MSMNIQQYADEIWNVKPVLAKPRKDGQGK